MYLTHEKLSIHCKLFCKLDVRRKLTVTVALSYDNRKTVVRYFVNRAPVPQQLRRRRPVATTADCRPCAPPLRQLRRRRLHPGTAATATPRHLPACLPGVESDTRRTSAPRQLRSATTPHATTDVIGDSIGARPRRRRVSCVTARPPTQPSTVPHVRCVTARPPTQPATVPHVRCVTARPPTQPASVPHVRRPRHQPLHPLHRSSPHVNRQTRQHHGPLFIISETLGHSGLEQSRALSVV